MPDNGHSDIAVAVAFLAGALVGAGVALLVTPKSGAEVRSQVGEWMNDMQEKAREAMRREGDEEGTDGEEAPSRRSRTGRASAAV